MQNPRRACKLSNLVQCRCCANLEDRLDIQLHVMSACAQTKPIDLVHSPVQALANYSPKITYYCIFLSSQIFSPLFFDLLWSPCSLNGINYGKFHQYIASMHVLFVSTFRDSLFRAYKVDFFYKRVCDKKMYSVIILYGHSARTTCEHLNYVLSVFVIM